MSSSYFEQQKQEEAGIKVLKTRFSQLQRKVVHRNRSLRAEFSEDPLLLEQEIKGGDLKGGKKGRGGHSEGGRPAELLAMLSGGKAGLGGTGASQAKDAGSDPSSQSSFHSKASSSSPTSSLQRLEKILDSYQPKCLQSSQNQTSSKSKKYSLGLLSNSAKYISSTAQRRRASGMAVGGKDLNANSHLLRDGQQQQQRRSHGDGHTLSHHLQTRGPRNRSAVAGGKGIAALKTSTGKWKVYDPDRKWRTQQKAATKAENELAKEVRRRWRRAKEGKEAWRGVKELLLPGLDDAEGEKRQAEGKEGGAPLLFRPPLWLDPTAHMVEAMHVARGVPRGRRPEFVELVCTDQCVQLCQSVFWAVFLKYFSKSRHAPLAREQVMQALAEQYATLQFKMKKKLNPRRKDNPNAYSPRLSVQDRIRVFGSQVAVERVAAKQEQVAKDWRFGMRLPPNNTAAPSASSKTSSKTTSRPPADAPSSGSVAASPGNGRGRSRQNSEVEEHAGGGGDGGLSLLGGADDFLPEELRDEMAQGGGLDGVQGESPAVGAARAGAEGAVGRGEGEGGRAHPPPASFPSLGLKEVDAFLVLLPYAVGNAVHALHKDKFPASLKQFDASFLCRVTGDAVLLLAGVQLSDVSLQQRRDKFFPAAANKEDQSESDMESSGGEDLGEEEKIAEKNKQSLGAGGQHEENSHADMDYSGFGVSLKEIAERSPLEQTLVEEALRDKARNKARRVRPRKAKFNANLISPALQKGLNRLTALPSWKTERLLTHAMPTEDTVLGGAATYYRVETQTQREELQRLLDACKSVRSSPEVLESNALNSPLALAKLREFKRNRQQERRLKKEARAALEASRRDLETREREQEERARAGPSDEADGQGEGNAAATAALPDAAEALGRDQSKGGGGGGASSGKAGSQEFAMPDFRNRNRREKDKEEKEGSKEGCKPRKKWRGQDTVLHAGKEFDPQSPLASRHSAILLKHLQPRKVPVTEINAQKAADELQNTAASHAHKGRGGRGRSGRSRVGDPFSIVERIESLGLGPAAGTFAAGSPSHAGGAGKA